MKKYIVLIIIFIITVIVGIIIYNNIKEMKNYQVKPTLIQNEVNNTYESKYTDYIHFICTELQLKDLTIMLGVTNLDIQGFVQAPNDDMFIILINPSKCDNEYVVIAHEMYHIKQHIEDTWNIQNGTTKLSDGSYVSFEAQKVEEDAIEHQYSLARSYRVNERAKRKQK